jgi:hypothetical protein
MSAFFRLVLAALGLVATTPHASLAATYTFSTSQSQFDADVDNQGWWSNGFPQIDTDNYLLGSLEQDDIPVNYRNFFTFDLTALPAGDIESATLRLTRYGDAAGNEATETIEFFDVSTDAATLNANSNSNFAIYEDLGSGTSYGSFVVSGTGASSDVLEFVLNGSALADIAAAGGGFFSVGGRMTSDDGADYLFAASGASGIQELVVVIPEPGTAGLMGIGLLGLRRARRR